jgi:hypothetical protein
VHCCFFDRRCWQEWWAYGKPMRFHWTKDRRTKYVTLWPFTGAWRSRAVWHDVEEG